jgi:hypothetical protein
MAASGSAHMPSVCSAMTPPPNMAAEDPLGSPQAIHSLSIFELPNEIAFG